MKALSIRQPWAWLIVNGHKDIENRTWPTKHTGHVLIHASKGMTATEYVQVRQWLKDHPDQKLRAIELPPAGALERGGIVGMAMLVGCDYDSRKSSWAQAWHFGFKLQSARTLPFTPLKGMLGLFTVDQSTVDAILKPPKKGDDRDD